MDDIEAAQMSLNVEDGSDSTDVVTTSNVSQMSWLISNPADNLIFFQIVFDSVRFVDVGMGESDGSGIVSDNVWDFVGSDGFLDNFTEFNVGFSVVNFDKSESALFIVKESEVFSSFDDIEDVHNSDWEFGVSSDLIIDFESCLLILGDNGDFLSGSCVSQSVPELMVNVT